MTREHIWACVSGGSCVAAFVASAVPYLQFCALVVSILAGLKALLSRKKDP